MEFHNLQKINLLQIINYLPLNSTINLMLTCKNCYTKFSDTDRLKFLIEKNHQYADLRKPIHKYTIQLVNLYIDGKKEMILNQLDDIFSLIYQNIYSTWDYVSVMQKIFYTIISCDKLKLLEKTVILLKKNNLTKSITNDYNSNYCIIENSIVSHIPIFMADARKSLPKKKYMTYMSCSILLKYIENIHYCDCYTNIIYRVSQIFLFNDFYPIMYVIVDVIHIQFILK